MSKKSKKNSNTIVHYPTLDWTYPVKKPIDEFVLGVSFTGYTVKYKHKYLGYGKKWIAKFKSYTDACNFIDEKNKEFKSDEQEVFV